MARWMGKLGFELEILADYTFRSDQRSRANIRRRDDIADACAWVGVCQDSVSMGVCQR